MKFDCILAFTFVVWFFICEVVDKLEAFLSFLELFFLGKDPTYLQSLLFTPFREILLILWGNFQLFR